MDPARTGRRARRRSGRVALRLPVLDREREPDSDRYVLSLPGSLQHRISPLDGSYDNFTITGDWTDCGFNFGCVEAATMAGRLAAHAISLRPALEDIVGYDHP